MGTDGEGGGGRRGILSHTHAWARGRGRRGNDGQDGCNNYAPAPLVRRHRGARRRPAEAAEVAPPDEDNEAAHERKHEGRATRQ